MDKEKNTSATVDTKDKGQTETKDTDKEKKPDHKLSPLELLKQRVKEDDPRPSAQLSLRKILGGDILNAEFVRSQLWLIVIIVLFTTVYVAFRFQCQQDIIYIDKLENQLKDAKYKALSSSSNLTEKCRESHILEILRNDRDSTLKIPDQPPYIINVPEK